MAGGAYFILFFPGLTGMNDCQPSGGGETEPSGRFGATAACAAAR